MTCSLCGISLPTGASKARVQNEDAAKTELMKRIARASSVSGGKIKRGLGTRRRVLSVVESLVELRRGRPVSRSKIIEECEENDWFFNRARLSITVTTNAEPDFGRYDYAYRIPALCCFIRGLCDQYNDEVRYEFLREGQYILTNQTSPIYLLYNKYLRHSNGDPDVSKMPIYFHRLVSARLAYLLAPNVTENQKIRSKVEIELSKAYVNAREKNGEDAYVADERGDHDWRDGARNYYDAYIE